MAISRIKTDGIQDEAVTSAKIGDNIDLDGQFVRVPHGTTAERPVSPVAGYLRFNTDIGTLEQWNTNTLSWAAVDSPPIITSVAYPGSVTAADPAGGETITVNGSNFKSGFSLTVGGTTAPTTTFVSSTQITFTTPAKTAGDYDIVVTNSNGLAATSTNGISYNGLPAFTTAAGNVGSVLGGDAMATITIVAAEPDGGTLAYSITSGALPTGTTLGSANGQITGTPTAPSSTTTFNFTVTATDDENQTNSRAFNLIVLRPIYATQIANSLTFEDGDSAYLSRTPSSDGNRKTWTFSAWFKPSLETSNYPPLFSADNSAPDVTIRLSNTYQLQVILENGGGGNSLLITNRLFRDATAWYHVVVAVDTTAATADSRIRIYINGVEETSFASRTNPGLNFDTKMNSTVLHRVGLHRYGSYWDGYMSDIYLIDGQALTPTSFGEEYNGVWAPIAYSGTYGTNGFHLDFADSSDLGNDVSGNNNDYTPNGFTVSDHVIDSPTNNFATLNPLTKGSYNSLNEGNLRLASVYASDLSGVSATQFFSSGKWYWEVRVNGIGTYPYVGIATPNRLHNSQGIYYTVAWNASGSNQTNSSDLGTITGVNVGSFANGDIIMLALDVDARKLWWGENGTWANSGDPAAGTGEVASWTVDEQVSPVIMGYSGQGVGTIMNFGQDSTFAGNETVASNVDSNGIGEFQYSPPTNFLAMTSKNLTESPINTSLDDRPEDYFNTVTYTGNNGTQTIAGVGFAPDLVWAKNRTTNGYHHELYDSVRGDNNRLFSSQNSGEITGYLALESNGFSLTSGGGINNNADAHVAWSWKAGGAPTATNTAGVGAVPTSGSVLIDGSASTSTLAGTIAADKISTNSKAKFSIVKYIGNGSGGATVAHGLGDTPDMIMLKAYGLASNWRVYVNGVSLSNTLFLNSTSTQTADGDRISAVDSTTFTLSSGNGAVNGNAEPYIAYCWKSVPGYSKMGTFTGRGAVTYVHTGFKPAFLMVKSFNTAAHHWAMYDNKRNTYNVINKYLYANSSGPESTADRVDFVSNGFVGRANNYDISQDGVGFVYMAFAEDPFKYVEAR